MSVGRKKGSRNLGYHHREGRGWFTRDASGKPEPLHHANGQRIREEKPPKAVLVAALDRYKEAARQKAKQPAAGEAGMTVLDVCGYYIEYLEREGAPATYEKRGKTLYDFCYGFSGRWWKSETKPTKEDRLHEGYGLMSVAELKPYHVQAWINAHKGWGPSGARTRIQAVKRALNYAATDMKLIDKNPIKGMKVPKGRPRATYLDDKQEAAILEHSNKSLATAVKVLIRTGMRPGEFCRLTPAHVTIDPNGIIFTLQAHETKTRAERSVRVREPWIVDYVKANMEKEFIFRNTEGGQWTERNLSKNFLNAKKRAEKAGVKFEEDTCCYSCRHSFAKRCLLGYWNDGKHITVEILANLMGNSPKICQDHYLRWVKGNDQHFWEAC